jgi:integrase
MQQLVEKFLAVYQGRLKPSTFADYRSILQCHISPRFTSFALLNEGLEEYLANLEITGKRKNNIISATRTFVSWGRRRRLFEGEFLEIPRFKHRRKRIKPLNLEEARLIMAYAPEPYKDFYQFSILTGLRTGEALGLRFDDFDFQKGLITIERSWTRGKIGTPKTEAGERTYPILRPLREIFQRRQLLNEKGSPWFFYSSNGNGGVYSKRVLRKKWHRLLDAFKVDSRPLYATRHTFASLAVAAGEDPLWVAAAMGHQGAQNLMMNGAEKVTRQLFLSYATYIEGVNKDGEKLMDLILGRQTLLRVAQ